MLELLRVIGEATLVCEILLYKIRQFDSTVNKGKLICLKSRYKWSCCNWKANMKNKWWRVWWGTCRINAQVNELNFFGKFWVVSCKGRKDSSLRNTR